MTVLPCHAISLNIFWYTRADKSGGGRRRIGGVWGQDWTEAGQSAEPAAVHSSIEPHHQEDGDDGCHEETPLCRRPGPGGEWQTGATGDTEGVERFVYQTWADNLPREDGCAAHRPPEGRAGHRAGGIETESTGQFHVPRRGSVQRREDGEREVLRRAQAGASMESSWGGDGRPADLNKTTRQGHEHLCDTSMPVRNGNLGNDRTTTTKAASVRKQLGSKHSKHNEGRQEKNGGIKGRDRSAEELNREFGEEQIIMGWTRGNDGGWQTEESGRVTWAGQEGGQGWDGRTVLRQMWRRQERRETGRTRRETEEGENTIRWGGEEVAGSTSPLIKGKRGSEKYPWP